jgi:predicted DNA binding CopG/RHH family protein
MIMDMVHVRIKSDLLVKAKKKAKEQGMIKANGEANLSQYIRNLIMQDLNGH